MIFAFKKIIEFVLREIVVSFCSLVDLDPCQMLK